MKDPTRIILKAPHPAKALLIVNIPVYNQHGRGSQRYLLWRGAIISILACLSPFWGPLWKLPYSGAYSLLRGGGVLSLGCLFRLGSRLAALASLPARRVTRNWKTVWLLPQGDRMTITKQ